MCNFFIIKNIKVEVKNFDVDWLCVALFFFFFFVPVDEYKGSVTYSDDTTTTNLYLGNLNPQVSKIEILKKKKEKKLPKTFFSHWSKVMLFKRPV